MTRPYQDHLLTRDPTMIRCNGCGVRFPVSPLGVQTTCADCRWMTDRAVRKDRARSKQKGYRHSPRDLVIEANRLLNESRPCQQCGGPLPEGKRDHCSKRCRDDARNQYKRSKRAESRPGPYQPLTFNVSAEDSLRFELRLREGELLFELGKTTTRDETPWDIYLRVLRRRDDFMGVAEADAKGLGYSAYDKTESDGYPDTRRYWWYPKPVAEGEDLDVRKVRQMDREAYGGIVWDH